MALNIVSRIGASPLGRAGVAIFSILALAGVVQFGLPLLCSAGALCAGEVETIELAGLDEAQLALNAALSDVGATSSHVPDDSKAEVAKLVQSPVPVASAGPAQVALAATPATLSYDNLIAKTFAVLDLGLTAPPGELTSRTVKTVTINADGTPMNASEAPPPLVAASEPPAAEPASSEEPAADVQVAEASNAPVVEDEPQSSLAYAPASGDVASVTGKGANVRSLPRRGGSEVLFALRGGEDVTIVQMSGGWAKIVDKQGRSGWIYGEYLNRS
ncbi:MAG: SH3 domain-containing protein [Hyphomicrobiales bacterium]|nr:MAG: SH3 domain-containing protein [Hyphomicrobiales bacterium]